MEKFKEYIKDLFYSIFKTSNLFKFALYSCITPLFLFILIACTMALPPIISYNRLKVEDITSKISYIDEAFIHILNQDVHCSINNSEFSCDEGYYYQGETENLNKDNPDLAPVVYQIYVNTEVPSLTVGEYGQHFATDNYIAFFKTTFRYRYVYHNPSTKQVEQYELIGFYDKLNGINFHGIYLASLEKENAHEYLLSEANNLLLNGYKAVSYEFIFTNVVASVGVYCIFILVVALLIKGNYILKKKKGLKYSQSLKIAIVASLQSALIALVLMLFGMSFDTALGLALVVRILYIYIRYTGSRKNTTLYKELYDLTNYERFNV